MSKHAQAKTVNVFVNANAREIHLILQDDGIGFDVGANKTKGLGLPSMRERIREVNGRINIASSPGDGTRIDVCVPRPDDKGTAFS